MLIGNGGFNGKPAKEGRVEVGYSILEEFQHNGYASEAVSGLLKWVFSYNNVNLVTAKICSMHRRSIRVLEKNGFVCIGSGSEKDVIPYELSRNAFQNPV